MLNLKCLAQTVTDIKRGPKILKVGYLTPPTPLDLILYFFVSAPGDQSACQI